MAALRAVARFPGKSALTSFQGVHANGAFSTLRRTPTRATSLFMQPLSPDPKTSPKRDFCTVIESYERGVVFRAGKHFGEKDPGLRWSFPVFNEVRKVDMRTRTMQIPSQELVTKDNVTIHVDAVAFYKVEDPLKALCSIEDCEAAVSEAAQVCVYRTAFSTLFTLNIQQTDLQTLTDLGARPAFSCSVRRSITRSR